MSSWIRIGNTRKSQRFKCPHCRKMVYSIHDIDGTNVCLYPMCPYCGKQVAFKDSGVKTAAVEVLTDQEKRIFLAAMGREEKVCAELDDASKNDRDIVRLVPVCNAITRKVKDSLWGEE